MSVTPIATEQDTDPIDWEAKFHKAVSANVRQADTHKRRQGEILAENQRLRSRITALEPFERDAETLKRERRARIAERHSYDNQITELIAKIREVEGHRHRGQRAVLEDVQGWIGQQIERLPAPDVAQ